MPKMTSWLVVDDDADVLKAAAAALRTPEVQVELRARPDGLGELARGYDAVLLDMNFAAGARAGREGLDALAELQGADPALAVVLMTTYGGVALAVDALKHGAIDFVPKPWRNEALVEAMRAATRITADRRAGAQLNLDEIERRAVERALDLHEGNVSRAAAALGLTRPALYRRMSRHGL
jgi:DNA-binding NtrC family response regulator